MKKLALFIHGLGGSAAGTWKQALDSLGFDDLLRSDAEIVEQFGKVDYPSKAWGKKPGLETCAEILKTEIETHCRASEYSMIALIAHSQGGIVARYYIAECINTEQPLRVKRLLTSATSHQGSGWATWAKWIHVSESVSL